MHLLPANGLLYFHLAMSVLAAPVTRPRRLRRVGTGALVLIALLSVAVSVLAGRILLHRGETMPGVQVLGADLGGLEPAAAAREIRAVTARRLGRNLTFSVGSRERRIGANELFALDRSATTAVAFEAGRESWGERGRALFSPLTQGPGVEPVLTTRPAARKRLADLLSGFVQPPVSARIVMRGIQPAVIPTREGKQPDLDALLATASRTVLAGERFSPLTVTFQPAAAPISDARAQLAADEARAMVATPVSLTFDGRDLGALEPSLLASLLRFREQGARLVPLFDEARLARVLDPRIAPWKRRAVNAQFAVNGAAASVIPARPGLAFDVRGGLVAVTTAAHARSDRIASLGLVAIPAELTTAEAEAYGIREQISSFTTEMGVSSSNRIHNVHLMADYIDGTVIPPGETFSFNRSVGPRTSERGFLEGQMIVGSLLLPSIGGGVCQTATTLFNNAFELGLPIVERHNHSFYISHYPMGRDATVSWGGPDFVFMNDFRHALLIKTSYTDSTLTFGFYGTSEGREVVSSTGSQANWREPKLTYALDPAAPAGSVRTERGSHQKGFDVTVFRKVLRDGKLLRQDSFTSGYVSVGDTQIYGPGRTIPGPYFVIPTT